MVNWSLVQKCRWFFGVVQLKVVSGVSGDVQNGLSKAMKSGKVLVSFQGWSVKYDFEFQDAN